MNWARNGTSCLPSSLGPGGGTKRSTIIKFQLQSQFKNNFNQTLCVFSQMKDAKIQMGFSFLCLGYVPGVGLVGGQGGLGGQKLFFSEIQPNLMI